MVRGDAPLSGIRVVEMASIGPGPHCCMLLSDLGAEVLRVDRPGGNGWPNPIVDRGRHVIELDLKADAGLAACRSALDAADVVVEGYRPGVMERLGLGPDILRAANPRLIYGRMTGWGQNGPLARRAGHDINYIALTGVLAALGQAGEAPPPPLNLVGDIGGGSLFLALGIVAALFERERSGLGQVIDAAIVDGVGSLFASLAGMVAHGASIEQGRSILSGAAPFYRTYRCADGRYMAVGAIEPHFYRDLLARIGAPSDLVDRQHDQGCWEHDGEVLAAIFSSRSRSDWTLFLEGADACCTPVLELAEAVAHPHNIARGMRMTGERIVATEPAPLFSRTPTRVQPDGDGERLLRKWRSESSVSSSNQKLETSVFQRVAQK